MQFRLLLLLVVLLTATLAAGCNAEFGDPPILPTRSGPDPEATSVEAVVQTLRAALPLGAAASTATPEPVPTMAPPEVTLCSPLPGYDLQALQAAISNPFAPPPFGSDDAHQGIDFANIQYGVAINGHDVQTVLPGMVASVIKNRYPYGNAVLVETPLSVLPPAMREKLEAATNITATPQPSALTCPNLPFELDGQAKQSLYLIYAHMEDPPTLAVGDRVGCGTPLGTIGQTGNALAPHLHLEARVGPAGATFSSIAHYEPYISEQEMANYCTWRISGNFMLVDPMLILENGRFSAPVPVP